MPKTRDAFALRYFDPTMIHKRKFFRFEEGIGFFQSRFFELAESDDSDMYYAFQNLWVQEDEDILDVYYSQAVEAQNKFRYDRVKAIIDIMINILSDINNYVKKIIRHYNRLEKYSKAWNNAISVDENLSADEIRSKTRRVQQLLKSYDDVQKAIKNLQHSIKKRIMDITDAYEKSDRNIFAIRLRQARMETGLTQTLLATKIGMTQSGYTNYENAIREPSITTLKKLARILGKSTDWLLGLTS